MEPQFSTIKKFSADTGLPEKTIRLGIKDGRLVWKPFGKRKLIDVKAFNESLSSKKSQIDTSDLPVLPSGGLAEFINKKQAELQVVNSGQN